MSDLHKEIMRRIRDLLEERQMSAAKFAAALRRSAPWTRASKSKVSLWFSGDQEIGVREVQAVAELFAVPVEDLIFGKGTASGKVTPMDAAQAIKTLCDELGYDVMIKKRRSEKKA